MTNKTDNRLTYRTDYAWCFDNPTLAAAMIDSLEDALQAAETKLAAIRDFLSSASIAIEYQSLSQYRQAALRIFNTTTAQPQCNCKNEHETVCDICAGGKEDSQPAQEQGGKE